MLAAPAAYVGTGLPDSPFFASFAFVPQPIPGKPSKKSADAIVHLRILNILGWRREQPAPYNKFGTISGDS